ncbi:hypothetical protein PUN4_10099 [Paraburkholderia unamae]|nr:hypothetical protein PUN4_10099 [Paraburkholderia unamae]
MMPEWNEAGGGANPGLALHETYDASYIFARQLPVCTRCIAPRTWTLQHRSMMMHHISIIILERHPCPPPRPLRPRSTAKPRSSS